MQRVLFAAFFSTALLLGGLSASAQTHHYVKNHPEERAMQRPDAPSAHHVWVGSEWNWSNGKYVEKPGHWTLPPHGHKEWSEGHWAKGDKGEYWVPGRWH
jgi:hypothetical protein